MPNLTYYKVKGNNRFRRFLNFILKFNKININYIYTRDIIVVLASLITCKNVIYEIHKKPRKIPEALLKKFGNKIKLCSISNGLKKYCINNLKYEPKRVIVLHDAVNYDCYKVMHSKGVI